MTTAERAQSAVTYDGLPLSSGSAHGLGRRRPRAAYAAYQDFLAACTEPYDTSINFTLPDGPELPPAVQAERELRSLFPARNHLFPVPADRLEEALAFLDRISPQPVNPWGMAPVWFMVDTRFRLRRPDGVLWPDQDTARFGGASGPSPIQLGECRSQLVLEGRCSMSLQLTIPNATDADLDALLPWLQEQLPFKLSPRHWRRYQLTTTGTSYRIRKIAPLG